MQGGAEQGAVTHCFSELTSSLSSELTQVLIKNWEELYPQPLGLEQKPSSCSYLY